MFLTMRPRLPPLEIEVRLHSALLTAAPHFATGYIVRANAFYSAEEILLWRGDLPLTVCRGAS